MKRVCVIRQKIYSKQRNMRRNANTLAKAGYNVDVFCVGSDGDKKFETINGVNIYRIYFSYHRGNVFWYLYDYAAFFFLASLRLVLNSFKKRYDVIEVQTMPDFIVFTTIIPRMMGSKVILYMFENTTELFAAKFHLGNRHILTRLVQLVAKISTRFADRIIVSDGSLHKTEFKGIPNDRITVILNVPDDAVFSPEAMSVPSDNKYFRLVVVSTVLERYGIQTLVEAIPLLLKEIPDLKIDIIGEGEYRLDLENMASRLGVFEYLNFTGFIPYENVPGYIARAHIGLAPVIEDVGAPNKIFEYFAGNKATVASAMPSFKSLFDESCVSYFQPSNVQELANRIIDLYRNPEKRAALARAGQEFYQKCQWSVMKKKYLGVYEQLIS